MSEKTYNKGMGVLGFIQIIFVLAKLFGVVSWSWWIVFSPLIFELIVVGIFLVFAGIFNIFFLRKV